MQGKLGQIQGIRALAMLGIFLAHTTVWLPDRFDAYAPIFLRLGGSGVAAFFILSGFLLAYKHRIVPKMALRDAIKSAWNKVNKMYVLYLITIAICFVSRLPNSVHEWLVKSVFVVFHITLTQDFIPFAALINAFNGPAWFLSALFGIWILIYLYPNGVNAMMNMSAKKCALAIGGIFVVQVSWMLLVEHGISCWMPSKYFSWCSDWLVYKNPILCLSEYCVGVLAGQLCAQKQLPKVNQNGIMLLSLCVITTYVVAMMNATTPSTVFRMVIAESFVLMGVLAVMSPQSLGYKLLSMRVLVWFGNISGYFFLIHTASIFMMRAIADYVPQWWLIIISFALSVLFSVCADYLYSENSTDALIIDKNNKNRF